MSVTCQKMASVVNFNTSRFGPLSVPEDKVINFVQGIPGFEKLRRFILIDHSNEGSLKWLQSMDDPDVAFLLTVPGLYKPDYTVPLKKNDIEGLGAKDTGSLVTLVMVSVSKEDRQLSLNLKGPVIFNSSNMKAMQCIIDKEDYQSRYVIKSKF